MVTGQWSTPHLQTYRSKVSDKKSTADRWSSVAGTAGVPACRTASNWTKAQLPVRYKRYTGEKMVCPSNILDSSAAWQRYLYSVGPATFAEWACRHGRVDMGVAPWACRLEHDQLGGASTSKGYAPMPGWRPGK